MIAQEQDIEILIHKRTPRSGHLTAVMSLPGAVAFADAELSQGRAVILEMAGTEPVVIRIGRQIVEALRNFVRGTKVTLTTISPMSGGQDVVALPPIPMPVRPYYDAPSVAPQPGNPMHRTSPEADMRAWTALVERLGESAARSIISGGGFAVRSSLWPHIIYVVTPDIIKIVNQGMQVGRICIVPQDGGSVWDAVLNRVQLLQAGVDGEVQVFASGNLMNG